MVLNNQILANTPPSQRISVHCLYLGCKKVLVKIFYNHTATPGLLIHTLADIIVGTVACTSGAKFMSNSDN